MEETTNHSEGCGDSTTHNIAGNEILLVGDIFLRTWHLPENFVHNNCSTRQICQEDSSLAALIARAFLSIRTNTRVLVLMGLECELLLESKELPGGRTVCSKNHINDIIEQVENASSIWNRQYKDLSVFWVLPFSVNLKRYNGCTLGKLKKLNRQNSEKFNENSNYKLRHLLNGSLNDTYHERIHYLKKSLNALHCKPLVFNFSDVDNVVLNTDGIVPSVESKKHLLIKLGLFIRKHTREMLSFDCTTEEVNRNNKRPWVADDCTGEEPIIQPKGTLVVIEKDGNEKEYPVFMHTRELLTHCGKKIDVLYQEIRLKQDRYLKDWASHPDYEASYAKYCKDAKQRDYRRKGKDIDTQLEAEWPDAWNKILSMALHNELNRRTKKMLTLFGIPCIKHFTNICTEMNVAFYDRKITVVEEHWDKFYEESIAKTSRHSRDTRNGNYSTYQKVNWDN